MNGLFRLMVIEHPAAARGYQPLPIHGLINSSHWEGISLTHVLAAVNYPAINHSRIDSHPMVLSLPSIQLSKTTLAAHAAARNKMSFFDQLVLMPIGATDTWMSADANEAAIKLFGTKFEPPF